MSSLSSEHRMASATALPSTPWVRPAIASAVLLVILGALFYDFLQRQFWWAIKHQADWGHTLVIPFIAGYFVHLNRDKLLARPFKTTWLGLVPVALGVAWYLQCTIGLRTLQHHNLQGLGVWITIVGVVILFCGWRAMRWLWFPLVYLLVFGQTISERLMNLVTFRMQDITAKGSHLLMSAFMDVERAGNTITLYHAGKAIPLNIAQACSGMRMLMAFLALGVAMAYTGLKHPWQRVLLVLLAVPTSIFVNILRVITLSLLTIIDSDLAEGDFHSFIGLVWLVPAFLIYLGLMWVIRNLVVDEPKVAETARVKRSIS